MHFFQVPAFDTACSCLQDARYHAPVFQIACAACNLRLHSDIHYLQVASSHTRKPFWFRLIPNPEPLAKRSLESSRASPYALPKDRLLTTGRKKPLQLMFISTGATDDCCCHCCCSGFEKPLTLQFGSNFSATPRWRVIGKQGLLTDLGPCSTES